MDGETPPQANIYLRLVTSCITNAVQTALRLSWGTSEVSYIL